MLNYTLKQLINKGVHLGHYIWESDFKMSYFLLGIRKQIHIINLNYTVQIMKQLLYLVYNLMLLDQRSLIINISGYSIFKFALSQYFWYVQDRWYSGLLTNYRDFFFYNPSIYMKYFGIGHSLLPSFVFVSNIKKSSSSIFEAIVLNIINGGFVDSNQGYYGIFYSLPGNDDNYSGMYLLSRVFSKTALLAIYKKLKLFFHAKWQDIMWYKKRSVLGQKRKKQLKYLLKYRFWIAYIKKFKYKRIGYRLRENFFKRRLNFSFLKLNLLRRLDLINIFRKKMRLYKLTRKQRNLSKIIVKSMEENVKKINSVLVSYDYKRINKYKNMNKYKLAEEIKLGSECRTILFFKYHNLFHYYDQKPEIFEKENISILKEQNQGRLKKQNQGRLKTKKNGTLIRALITNKVELKKKKILKNKIQKICELISTERSKLSWLSREENARFIKKSIANWLVKYNDEYIEEIQREEEEEEKREKKKVKKILLKQRFYIKKNFLKNKNLNEFLFFNNLNKLKQRYFGNFIKRINNLNFYFNKKIFKHKKILKSNLKMNILKTQKLQTISIKKRKKYRYRPEFNYSFLNFPEITPRKFVTTNRKKFKQIIKFKNRLKKIRWSLRFKLKLRKKGRYLRIFKVKKSENRLMKLMRRLKIILPFWTWIPKIIKIKRYRSKQRQIRKKKKKMKKKKIKKKKKKKLKNFKNVVLTWLNILKNKKYKVIGSKKKINIGSKKKINIGSKKKIKKKKYIKKISNSVNFLLNKERVNFLPNEEFSFENSLDFLNQIPIQQFYFKQKRLLFPKNFGFRFHELRKLCVRILRRIKKKKRKIIKQNKFLLGHRILNKKKDLKIEKDLQSKFIKKILMNGKKKKNVKLKLGFKHFVNQWVEEYKEDLWENIRSDVEKYKIWKSLRVKIKLKNVKKIKYAKYIREKDLLDFWLKKYWLGKKKLSNRENLKILNLKLKKLNKKILTMEEVMSPVEYFGKKNKKKNKRQMVTGFEYWNYKNLLKNKPYWYINYINLSSLYTTRWTFNNLKKFFLCNLKKKKNLDLLKKKFIINENKNFIDKTFWKRVFSLKKRKWIITKVIRNSSYFKFLFSLLKNKNLKIYLKNRKRQNFNFKIFENQARLNEQRKLKYQLVDFWLECKKVQNFKLIWYLWLCNRTYFRSINILPWFQPFMYKKDADAISYWSNGKKLPHRWYTTRLERRPSNYFFWKGWRVQKVNYKVHKRMVGPLNLTIIRRLKRFRKRHYSWNQQLPFKVKFISQIIKYYKSYYLKPVFKRAGKKFSKF